MSISDSTITGGLNDPQLKAVQHSDGPILILAGAGSGKTRALTHRIARLMKDGVQPWQILAVTFTNKAASEMKERISRLLEITEGENPLQDWGTSNARMPVMGTFHSICARILRRDIEHIGRDRSFVIYDSDDQLKLVKEILKSMGIDDKELKPKAALGYIGRFKCEALSPKEAEVQATTQRMHHVIDVYKKYQAELFKANALDFDDLILETVRLFTEVPAVLERYQNTWQYLHVDEYQDTNHAQYLFISLLAKKHRNLCVIGDPDQSIYSFRGADIRNILEFEKEYPDAEHIKLEQNYRSTQLILSASDEVIKPNPNRPEKKMWSERKEGPKIIVQETSDERKEAQEAIHAAQKLKTENVPLSNQVVLYRTNAQSRLFEEACMRAGVPYRIIGGVKFYARREVKDVLAYLHVILNPHDTVALLRIINVPARKIGLTTMGKIQAYASQQSITLWDSLCQIDHVENINEPTKIRITKFVELIKKYQTRLDSEVASELSGHLLNDINFDTWLKDGTEEGEERWGNVQELLTVMRKYDQLEPRLSVTSFLEEVALVSEVDRLTDASDDALTLMTLHLCKGLEFEHVMVAGCEEGIFPHSNSAFDKEQLEEERRLMYVGMTRAKTHLRLLHARTRMQWGNMEHNAPSRFMEDIPEDLVERRSDDVLSAFAWASARGARKARETNVQSIAQSTVEPYRQNTYEDFNQDDDFEIDTDDFNQDTTYAEGTRVNHPTFGNGTITTLRGDVADVLFDSGDKKTLALSIAPIRPL